MAEGEDAGVETRSQTGSASERGIVKQLKWSLEEEGHQRGQTGEERARSKDRQEGSQATAG